MPLAPDSRAVTTALRRLTMQAERCADALTSLAIEGLTPVVTPDAGRRNRVVAALTAEHYRRAHEQIIASPEEHSAAMADVALLALSTPVADTPSPPTTADDGTRDRLASWLYAHCDHHPDSSFICDDPHTIARYALLWPDQEADRLVHGNRTGTITGLLNVIEQQPTTGGDGPRCVCGDTIEWWTGPGESAGWIHSPGSDTPCLDAHVPRPPARDDDATTTPVDEQLLEQYAAAMREHYLSTNRDEADADGNMPCRCGDWREPGPMATDEEDWDHHLAEAVLAVRDHRIERVRAIKKSPSRSRFNLHANAQDDGWDQALDAVHAALDDPLTPVNAPDVEADNTQLRQRLDRVIEHRARVEAERDGAYRERAHLVALLAARYPSVIAPALDLDEPGWWIAYLTLGGRQASWHISPRDAGLFTHVERVEPDDRRAQWDGHTTEAKYEHIAALASRLYAEARGLAETPLTPADEPPKTITLCGAPGPWNDGHACIHPAGHSHGHEAHDGCGWNDEPGLADAKEA